MDNYVNKHYADVKDYDAALDLKSILSDLKSTVGDLELKQVCRMDPVSPVE